MLTAFYFSLFRSLCEKRNVELFMICKSVPHTFMGIGETKKPYKRIRVEHPILSRRPMSHGSVYSFSTHNSFLSSVYEVCAEQRRNSVHVDESERAHMFVCMHVSCWLCQALSFKRENQYMET